MAFTHAAGDQPAVLRAKIENDDRLAAFRGMHIFPFSRHSGPNCVGTRFIASPRHGDAINRVPTQLATWTACYINNLAADKTGLVRTEEADDIGDIAWLPNTTHRYNF